MKGDRWFLGFALWILFALVLFANNSSLSSQRSKQKNKGLLPSVLSIRTNNVRKVYINVAGIYKQTKSDDYSSLCLPKSVFNGYQYISIKANREWATRVHILKEEPKNKNERVLYSDFFRESIVVRKGMKLDIVIPSDAGYIILLNSSEGHHNTPDSISLYTEEGLSGNHDKRIGNLSFQKNMFLSHRFLHWNLGHFSNGQYPYSTITKDNYNVKLDGFKTFLNTYCPDCHYLLNEYDETFATISGKPIKTDSVLFNNRIAYSTFPRSTSTGYNKLATFWKEGLIDYEYGFFESLKGVKNSRGTLEYGAGYCISKFSIGIDTLYVMGLHAPNRIKGKEHNALYHEIIDICSGYDNCILVGDFNRTSFLNFRVLTDAGFKILNNRSVTYPSKSDILDWVLYKCKDVTLSDFKVYKEAVDSKGELLSDHLPLSFKVTHK